MPTGMTKTRERAASRVSRVRSRPLPDDEMFLTSVPYLIYRSSSALTEHLRTILKNSGLSVAQWRILSSLSAKRSATVNDLVACTAMKQPTVSKAVTEMEATKLIVRDQIDRDQRVVHLSLSPKGVDLLNSLRPLATKHVQLAQHGLDARDIETLQSLLGKLLENLHVRR